MALELNGTTGVSLVQDGVVTAADLASTLDLTGKTVTLPSGTGGKVLQVVNVTNSTSYTGTAGAETALFNFSITPTSSSSKIAIFVSLAAGFTGTVFNFAGYFILRRGTTTTGTQIQKVRFGQYQGGSTGTFREFFTSVFLNGLDSPATTSSQSYCITVADLNGYPDYAINNNGTTTITLMEIAA